MINEASKEHFYLSIFYIVEYLKMILRLIISGRCFDGKKYGLGFTHSPSHIFLLVSYFDIENKKLNIIYSGAKFLPIMTLWAAIRPLDVRVKGDGQESGKVPPVEVELGEEVGEPNALE